MKEYICVQDAQPTNISLIAGTFRNSSSVIRPSPLQCLENSDCSASPSEAGGYSTVEDAAAAMEMLLLAFAEP